mmetsp:Transcript_56438/g.112148  ORF Transcript_56438/g.112148 Transcript_56438/m.112148 type:complete len:226 (-) Transcript_56438:1142-1819(-)
MESKTKLCCSYGCILGSGQGSESERSSSSPSKPSKSRGSVPAPTARLPVGEPGLSSFTTSMSRARANSSSSDSICSLPASRSPGFSRWPGHTPFSRITVSFSSLRVFHIRAILPTVRTFFRRRFRVSSLESSTLSDSPPRMDSICEANLEANSTTSFCSCVSEVRKLRPMLSGNSGNCGVSSSSLLSTREPLFLSEFMMSKRISDTFSMTNGMLQAKISMKFGKW